MDHCLCCGEFAPLGGGVLIHLPWCVFTPRLTYEELWKRQEGKMPKGTKVDKAERALKASAAKRGFKGRRADRYVYSTLNKLGLKRGNKTTKRGAQRASRSPS